MSHTLQFVIKIVEHWPSCRLNIILVIFNSGCFFSIIFAKWLDGNINDGKKTLEVAVKQVKY